jgi:hypothetical protein
MRCPAVPLASFRGVPSLAFAPFFSSARPEHLHDPAFVDPLFHIHSLLSFFHIHPCWGGRYFYVTGSSHTGRFPLFVLEGVDTSTVSNPWFVVPEGADTLTTSSFSATRRTSWLLSSFSGVAVLLHLGFSCPRCISLAADVSSRTSVLSWFLSVRCS